MQQPLATTPDSLAQTLQPRIAPGDSVMPTDAPEPFSMQDHQTLAQLRRGNHAAIEQLVQRYQDRLFSTVFRLVGHPDDAADLVQETFVKAIQNISRFEGKSSLYTWLFRIAVNLSISHRRAAVYRQTFTLDGDATKEENASVNQQAASLRRELSQTTEPDPAETAEQHLEHERIIAALARLDPDFRAVIVLRDIEDCDYEKIAAILEIPVGTVKSRLFRARAALRELLTRQPRQANGTAGNHTVD